MSYLENIKNYSHCPLKKRPLYHILEDDDDYDNKPQDLRVKRRKEEEDLEPKYEPVQSFSSDERVSVPYVAHLPTFSPVPTPENGSHCLLDTSAAALPATESKMESRIPPLADFYLQLFQQTAYHQQKMSSWENVWPIIPSGTWNPVPQTHPIMVASPISPPTEPHLSSPRSTSSEDSGIGCEVISEDEIDVVETSLEKPFPNRHFCESCGKSYSTQSGLRKHSELHCSSLGPRAFSCKHCSKAYTSIGALKMHIRTHTLPCKCHVCGKAFSRPWLLQGHIRTHTGEKPFECQQCHRSFADRSNLRAHQQTHERVKKYACQTCKKTFSRMSLLNKHSENACQRTLNASDSN